MQESRGLDIQGLIFSKDRPLQLDGTLRSFSRHCLDAEDVTLRVLYTASNSRIHSLYRQLMREYPHVQFVEEFDFQRDTNLLLTLHDFVIILVDDNLFICDFVAAELVETLRHRPDAIGVSLRLGRNTTYCYSLDKPQGLPNLQPVSPSLLEYRWPDTAHDFGYPLEVSSSLYRSSDLLSLVEVLTFRNPNTLEAELANQAFRFRDTHPMLLCPDQSIAFCAPVNLVQQVSVNRAGSRGENSVMSLAAKFAAGWRMDISQFDGLIPTACHQEVELPLSHSSTSTPLVSVIVPCYKQAKYLKEAVESVVAQTFTDWELIIVDDGSPDDTVATAKVLISENPGRSIRLLRKQNAGLSEARNDGIRNACGAYILPLDADDMIRPTMLEKTVRLLDSRPDIAIAYTDITHFGAVDVTIQAAEYDATKIPINNQLNYCSLYRYEAWVHSGGYRSFFWGYEDWDFWVGCAAAGLGAVRIPEPLLLYRVKQGSMYKAALSHDGELRARIVLNHPQLYPAYSVAEARSVLVTNSEPQSPGAPLVSVIVPTHNRPQSLCEALKSILAQTMQDFEIIVVNDAGLDIAPWVRSLDQSGRIRLLRHPHNRGQAAARNTGLRAARGKYVAYLDDDDLYYPHHLAVLTEEAENSGHEVVFSNSCQALYSQHDGQTFVDRSFIHKGGFSLGDLMVHNRLPVLSVLHRRSCIDKIRGFDETLATNEDWDMWIRLFHQYPYIHVDQTTSEYRVEPNGSSLSNKKNRDFYRTMRIIHQTYRRIIPALTEVHIAQRMQLDNLAKEIGHPVNQGPMTDVYQAYFGDSEKKLLSPKTIPWSIENNTGKSTREYELFKEVAITRKSNSDPWGLVSRKFNNKTPVSIEAFIEFADQKFAEGFDCAFINPMIGNEALHLNVWQQGISSGHTGMEKVSRFLGNTFGISIYAPMDKSTFAMCNYFIAKPSFWSNYFSFVDHALLELDQELAKGTEVGMAYASSANYTKDKNATMKPFIIERLLSTFIQNYPTNAAPYAYAQSHYEKKFGNLFGPLLYQLSELKSKGLQKQCRKSITSYNEILAIINSSPAYWFTISNLDDAPDYFSSVEYYRPISEHF